MRLFFALWPGKTLARKWHGLGRRWHPVVGGRLMPIANLHLTLVFLGEVPEQRVSELQTCVAALVSPPVRLVLTHAGYWKHNGIVWLGPETLVPELAALMDELHKRLTAAGFALEQREYVPHITLLRKALREPGESLKPMVWESASFVLAGSTRVEGGSSYAILGRWPLTGKYSEPAAR